MVSGSTLTAGQWVYVAYTYVTAAGESRLSPPTLAQCTASANGNIQVNQITVSVGSPGSNASVLSINVYASAAVNPTGATAVAEASYYLVGNVALSGTTTASPATTISALPTTTNPPTANTTGAVLAQNPTASYATGSTDADGNIVVKTATTGTQTAATASFVQHTCANAYAASFFPMVCPDSTANTRGIGIYGSNSNTQKLIVGNATALTANSTYSFYYKITGR
jgi:hypothetical protein